MYDSETFAHNGHEFKVTIEHDCDMGPPWKEYDGHGVVSEWTTRDKAAGEKVLCSDRTSRRYYDVSRTMQIARRDGWGVSPAKEAELAQLLGRAPTRGEIVAAAVDSDFEYLRAWCNDEWQFVTVGVTLLDDGETVGETEYLGGVENSDSSYLLEVAHELASQIIYELDGAAARMAVLADAYGCAAA